MIKELSQDLIDKIKAALPRCGMATGGGPVDPHMQEAELPAAWIVFEGETTRGIDNIRGRKQEDVDLSFRVIVVLAYGTQADLLNNQLPTLEAVRNAISGTAGPKEYSGDSWKYHGTGLVEVAADRLVYELRVSIAGSIQ